MWLQPIRNLENGCSLVDTAIRLRAELLRKNCALIRLRAELLRKNCALIRLRAELLRKNFALIRVWG
jgi:hypothetical protein